MKKAKLLTLGCRVNQYEAEACAELLHQYGYTTDCQDTEVDLYWINTCSVTAESDRKCRQSIHKILLAAKKNGASVVIAGCHIQAHPHHSYAGPRVFCCGNTDKLSFLQSVLERKAPEDDIPLRKDMKEYYPTHISSSKHTKAYIKIEDGCDHFCSYCIVPHLRGPVRSRPTEDILCEAKRLSENGFREVVLTGIETSFYGKDLIPKTDLCQLSEQIAKLPGIKRIRFGSLRPTVFTEEFTKRLSQNKKVLGHFHLSIQSGSDAVLAMMKRHYTRQNVLEVLDRIRSHFDDVTFSADLICGFPGETERDFQDSKELVTKAALLHAHIFPYSERPGTPAAQMQNQVSIHTRKERCATLLSHSNKVARETIAEYKGKRFTVLVEKIVGHLAYGYTDNFIYTQFSARNLKKGDLVEVELEDRVEQKPNAIVVKSHLCE